MNALRSLAVLALVGISLSTVACSSSADDGPKSLIDSCGERIGCLRAGENRVNVDIPTRSDGACRLDLGVTSPLLLRADGHLIDDVDGSDMGTWTGDSSRFKFDAFGRTYVCMPFEEAVHEAYDGPNKSSGSCKENGSSCATSAVCCSGSCDHRDGTCY